MFLIYLSDSHLSLGHYEGLLTACGPRLGPPEWYSPSSTFIAPKAEVSIAFSALNSCSVITRWTSKFDWQLVALTCTWKLTEICLFYWLMIHNSMLFVQSLYGPAECPLVLLLKNHYMDQQSTRSCYYWKIETCMWCVSTPVKSVLHLWYALICVSEMITSPSSVLWLWPELYCLNWTASWQNQQNECVPSEDSDQPGHPPSLIRVFAVRMKKAWVLSYPLSAQGRLIRLGGCPGWSESSLGTHAILLVLSWGSSFNDTK